MRNPGVERPGIVLLAALGALWGTLPTTASAQQDRQVRQKALLIAVQKYDDPRLSLSVTLQDSIALKKTLMERAGILERDITSMNDEAPAEFRPTLANVRRELKEFLDGAQPTDRLLIFFSGHGFVQGGQTYLVPADFDVKDPKKTGLPAAEIRDGLTKCQAAVKFLILDCCQAGGEKALPDPQFTDPELTAKGLVLDRVPGCVVLASCQAQEKSYEWPERRQSVFTYWLCRGLDGGADKDADGKITADEVYEYAFEHVTKTVAQMPGGKSQTPVRQIGVGVVGVSEVLSLLPESPESLCDRLAAHLDVEARLRKLKKVGVLEFLEPTGLGQADGLARAPLPAYCAERVRTALTKLAGESYAVLGGQQFRPVVRKVRPGDVGNPLAMKSLAERTGGLDALVSGTLKRRGKKMAVSCEMVSTQAGDTLASPSGMLPLTLGLDVDNGQSFGSALRKDGGTDVGPAPVAPPDKDKDGQPNVGSATVPPADGEKPQEPPAPPTKQDLPFRVEIYTLRPDPGEKIGPKTRRVRREFLGGDRVQQGGEKDELIVAFKPGEVIEFWVSNKSDKRVGLALMIDGVNTLGQRRERVEKARLWVLEPGATNAIDGWRESKAGGQADGSIERVISKQFLFSDLPTPGAERQQFGDSIGTITAAFFAENSDRGIIEGEKTEGDLKIVPFVRGPLVGAINVKYVNESELRTIQAQR